MITKTIIAVVCLISPFLSLANEREHKDVRIYHLGSRSSVLFLRLNTVNKELFNQKGAESGFSEIILIDRNERYVSSKHEMALVEHILAHIGSENEGRKEYSVGPMSAHGSERYIIESGDEILFVTPHWEDHWKKYDTLKTPMVDVQRCTKIGETTLNGVKYDIYEISGRYHQYLEVPRNIADEVDWFEYRFKDSQPDEEPVVVPGNK